MFLDFIYRKAETSMVQNNGVSGLTVDGGVGGVESCAIVFPGELPIHTSDAFAI